MKGGPLSPDRTVQPDDFPAMAQALLDTAGALGDAPDETVLFARVLDQAARMASYDAAAIVLIESNQARVACHAESGDHPLALRLDASPAPLGAMPPIQMAIAQHEPVVVSDAQAVMDWLSFTQSGWIRSHICVPLVYQDQSIGLLTLSHAEPGYYTPQRATRLQAFADLVSVMLHQWHDRHALQSQVARLEQRIADRTAALHHATERVEAILNNSSDAIILAYEDGTIDQTNLTFDREFQFGPDELYRQPVTTIAHAGTIASLDGAFRAVVESGETRKLDIVATRKDGSVFFAEAGLSLIPESEDQHASIVISLRDISERKRAEEELLITIEKERELNELKSRFVSMTSHEFRTPMATIQATVASLAHYFERMTPEQRAKRFEKIDEQIARMTRLLDDILTVGRLEAGMEAFSPEETDLDAFLATVIKEFQRTELQHELVIESDCPCGMVRIDQKLVRQILNSVLSNAVKFSPQESTVRVQKSCADEHQVILRIIDSGIGIPERDRERLYEAFHRAQNVGTMPGTGLGLTIARYAADLHGGSIEIDSEVDVGTTVTISIPRKSR